MPKMLKNVTRFRGGDCWIGDRVRSRWGREAAAVKSSPSCQPSVGRDLCVCRRGDCVGMVMVSAMRTSEESVVDANGKAPRRHRSCPRSSLNGRRSVRHDNSPTSLSLFPIAPTLHLGMAFRPLASETDVAEFAVQVPKRVPDNGTLWNLLQDNCRAPTK